MKRLLFIVLFLMPMTTVTSASSENQYLSESVNLIQNGSLLNPYIINTTEDYDYITEIVWHFHFTTTVLNYLRFGINTALTNGINVLYNGETLIGNDNLTTTKDLGYGIYVFTVSNASDTILVVSKWNYRPGLWISQDRQFQVYIQDDMTALGNITEFSLQITGYKKIVSTYFNDPEKFYPNAINQLTIRDLYVGTDYNLKISSDNLLDGEKWINTTALQDEINIKYTFETRESSVITLSLYQDDEFLERLDLFVQRTKLDGITPFLITLVPLLAFVISSAFLIKRFQIRRPKKSTFKRQKW